MNQKIKKIQDCEAGSRDSAMGERQMSVNGNLNLQFGIKILGKINLSKEQKILSITIILILAIAVIAFVTLVDPQFADKLLRILETIMTVGQIFPSWKNTLSDSVTKGEHMEFWPDCKYALYKAQSIKSNWRFCYWC